MPSTTEQELSLEINRSVSDESTTSSASSSSSLSAAVNLKHPRPVEFALDKLTTSIDESVSSASASSTPVAVVATVPTDELELLVKLERANKYAF
jgi:hypothetical protein